MRASVSRKRRSVSRSRAEAIVDFGDADEVVELPLCVAPEGAELHAAFALFGEPGGYVLDAFEPLFAGYDLLHCN